MIEPPVPASSLEMAVRFTDGPVVRVVGELDVLGGPELAAVLGALAGRGHRRITVECDELGFLDAAGLRALVACEAQLAASGGEVHVRGLSPLAYRVVEVTGLVEALHARRRAGPPDPGGDTGPVTGQLAILADESARTDELSGLLARILAVAPGLIGPCDGVSVTLRRGEHLTTAAVSDEAARALDAVQHARRVGPCVDAAQRGVQVYAADLADEPRWGDFSAQARERGVHSVLSSPMLVGAVPVGAVTLYSRRPNAFRAADRARAGAFAALASVLFHRRPDPPPRPVGELEGIGDG